MTCLASGIILCRRDPAGLLLLVLRNRADGHWGFAKGRRAAQDAHEVQTALREVAEETGYTELLLHPDFREEIAYDVAVPDGARTSKRVVYFLAQAPGGEVTLSPEHDALRWITPAQIGAHLEHAELRAVAAAAVAAAASAEVAQAAERVTR
jgi:8-oxo-dGTP pyrophosphatase MutT (NUDIX family)